MKTHTPLDGIPIDDRGRRTSWWAAHPLDLAVSLYHQGDNIDRERLAELTGVPAAPAAPGRALHDWLVRWTRDGRRPPLEQPDSLAGVLHHLCDAWSREHGGVQHRAGALRRPAGRPAGRDARGSRGGCGIDVPEERLPVAGRRRRRSHGCGPGPASWPRTRLGVLKDSAVFFRSGRSGTGRELLTSAELEAYDAARRQARAAGPGGLAAPLTGPGRPDEPSIGSRA